MIQPRGKPRTLQAWNPFSSTKCRQRKYYRNQTEGSVTVKIWYLFRACILFFFPHTYRGYSHQIQLNYFIVIVHLVHSIPHQSGNKLILIPDQKKKKNHSMCIRETATEGRKSEICFKTAVLITDTRVQMGNKIPLGQKEACADKKTNLRNLLI